MIYLKYFSFIETVLFMLERRLNNLLGSTDFEVPRKTWYVIFFISEVVIRLPLAAVFFGRPISISSLRHVAMSASDPSLTFLTLIGRRYDGAITAPQSDTRRR